MKTIAILAAAGEGRRLDLRTEKPFVRIKGNPLVSYALKRLDAHPAVDAIIIAAHPASIDKMKRLIARYRLRKVAAVVAGGKTRFESVRNCLDAVGPSYDIVLVHDAARPLISGEIISGSVRTAAKYGACVVVVPETDTVKSVDARGFVVKTLDRTKVFRAQTPQAFRREIISKLYSRPRTPRGITDDSMLAELAGIKVKILTGSYNNLKITTKEDLHYAEGLL